MVDLFLFAHLLPEPLAPVHRCNDPDELVRHVHYLALKAQKERLDGRCSVVRDRG
jgi:hypothetical protein